ncbi:MAG: hypothetical protein KDN19_02445 [Verrucomicrobiae bacterium]|nr:hypothetical protein [Verrucomicrobiae bacterium]
MTLRHPVRPIVAAAVLWLTISWTLSAKAQIRIFGNNPPIGQGGGAPGAAIPGAAPTVRGEKLVPAAMNVITDKQGNSWNLEQNGTLGRVGNSMVNSGLTLLINNQQFYTYQPMMTADGSEFVLLNRPNSGLPGLQILRRIRVMEKEGALRFLEVLTNSNANAITVSVALRTNFSGNYKTYLTDQGNSGVTTLGQRESAILVTPGSNQSNRAFAFTLCDPKSPVKPTISSQNKYGLTFQYNLTIPGGQTVAIAHAVSQLPTPREFDRQALAKVFRPVSIDRLMGTIPREFRPLMVNDGGSTDWSGESMLRGGAVADLGVDRGRRDVLALGERTRLIGSANCAGLKVVTAYGEAEVPFETVAAVVGGNRGRRDVSRVMLRDGQVFSGEIEAADLRFSMASGGKMNLQIPSLDRLVCAKADADGSWDADAVAMVETYGGDRLAANGSEVPMLEGMTPWGPLAFSLDEIVWLAPMEDEPVGHYVEFKNGTRCYLFLAGAPLRLQSDVFGACELDSAQVKAVVTRAALDRAREAEEQGRAGALFAEMGSDADSQPPTLHPYVLAAGGQRIVGDLGESSLHVLTHSETVPVAPREIRRMVNLTAAEGGQPDAAGPVFRIELWGGGVLAGYLGESDLEMQVRGASWRLPLTDLRELVTPVPRLTEGAQQDIARLIRELGSDDWQTREKATEELQSFGYLAQSILREELRTNPDPEVQRRLERILLSIQ